MGSRIVIFGSERGWHSNSLIEAFRARGVTPVVTSLRACAFSCKARSGVSIPGLSGALPRGAFVRMVPSGSFEEVTLFLGLLHALGEMGVTVWNGARAIERCVDKSTATFLLNRAGLPTPATWAGTELAGAEAIVRRAEREGRVLVQKPLFGAQGRGLRLVRTRADLAPPADIAGAYYLQDYVGPSEGEGRDWRLLVCQGRVIAAMVRIGTSWITNVAQGARAEAAEPPAELCDMAIRAAACIGAAYAGVDIVADAAGRYLILELNSMPSWSALERVTGARVADRLVEAFLDAASGA